MSAFYTSLNGLDQASQAWLFGLGKARLLCERKASACPAAGGYAPAFFSILAQVSLSGSVRLNIFLVLDESGSNTEIADALELEAGSDIRFGK